MSSNQQDFLRNIANSYGTGILLHIQIYGTNCHWTRLLRKNQHSTVLFKTKLRFESDNDQNNC